MLNICVDAPDATPSFLPEDLSINDQESIIEIVVEKILGFENAIAEYDDPDSEENISPVKVKLDLAFMAERSIVYPTYLQQEKKPRFYEYDATLALGFSQIDSPPPKV
ncbi:hypothetical protein V6R21_14860 [Limibacter armeniacum]|uniref:hypothetical protein n=1 Tax=Limibacter armeniacum TaxID=466084 RepID=UPI002FE5E2BB